MEPKSVRFFNKKKYHLRPTRIITDRAIAEEIAEEMRNEGDYSYAKVITERDNEQEYYSIYYRYDLQKIKQKLKKNEQQQLSALLSQKKNL